MKSMRKMNVRKQAQITMIGVLLTVGVLLSTGLKAQTETTTETTVQTETRTDSSPDRMRPAGGPRAGIKGGVNLSNFITDEPTDRHTLVGFHAGVYGQLFVNEGFAIQPEVNYSTKGNEITSEFGIIDHETKFNLHYIDLPVLAVFKLGDAVEIHAGPYWAYLVGANIDTDGDLGDGFRQLDRDNFDNWDYGLVGGIGFNFNNVQLGARYNYGLNNIAESPGARQMLGSKSKNSVGQLYLAFNLAGSR
ncbi:MAG TPA: porin family protein [Cyclobacteriaceae bacterium]|jgi:hypothetical protein